MPSKIHGKTAIKCDGATTTTQSIPSEVLRGLSPAAADRLKGFVEASENFRRRVYGEENSKENR